ncbi:MAG: HDOD domain-containing protein [Spirochaetes bacterium]|nr:HDOD domain-containing protein [Spirochaetota bacterium]
MKLLEPGEIRDAVENGRPLHMDLSGAGRYETGILVKNLLAVLEATQTRYLAEAVIYILRELVTNGDKANLKRAHFQILGLDPTRVQDYEKGMASFHTALRTRLDEYRAHPAALALQVHVEFQVSQGALTMVVTNPCSLLPQERARIEERLTSAHAAQGLMDSWKKVSDNAEGAGIGLLMVVFMLRNIGVADQACRFHLEPGAPETTVRVTIPLDTVPQALGETLSGRIAEAVESVPPIPDTVRKLRELLDADASFIKVAALIQNDPGLTVSLLKLVNGPLYLLPKRISNITAACSLMGLKGLRTLLLSYGALKAVETRYGRQENLWEHACLCASYARHLAGFLGHPALAEDAHVGGLLHDLGKLVLLDTHPELVRNIERFSLDQGVGGNLLERVALGVSHARIGALMAARWQFPGNIHAAIEFHHRPLVAPAEFQPLCDLVYLANLFCMRHSGDLDFDGAEPSVLARHGIRDETAFHEMGARLEGLFRKQKEKDLLG